MQDEEENDNESELDEEELMNESEDENDEEEDLSDDDLVNYNKNSEMDQQEENDDQYSFDDDSDADEEDLNENNWRTNIAKKASDTFYKYLENTDSIQKLVYGKMFELKDDREQDDEPNSNDVFNINDNLYRLTLNGLDSTKFDLKRNRNWDDEEVLDSIKDCFVTGKWTEDENAEVLLRENEEEMEEYGDFEDLEMNENEGEESEDEESEDDEDLEANKRRMELKKKLKEEFNTNYDDKTNSDKKNRKNEDNDEDDDDGPEESKFYREIKKKLERQAQVIIDFFF